MGKLYAVGFGPGGYEHMTAKAIDVIKNADIITGYTTYVEMLKKFFPEKEYVATPMTKEMDRCRMAVDLAAEGKTVANGKFRRQRNLRNGRNSFRDCQ